MRGLTVNSLGSNAIGVILNGRTLHIENCILNSNEIGVWSTGPGMLDVKDSVFRGNLFGIKVEPTSGTSAATIEKTRFEANSDGLDAADGAIVTVHNSLASGNLNLGFGAASFTSRAVEMNLEVVCHPTIKLGFLWQASRQGRPLSGSQTQR